MAPQPDKANNGNGNGPNPLDFRRDFDHGPGSGPLLRTSAAYSQFARHIQYLAEQTQAVVDHLEWEALAAERAQEAVAAFYLSMQQYAEVAQTAAVAAQSSAGSYTQANQNQMTQEIIMLVLVGLIIAVSQMNLPQMVQKGIEWAAAGMLAFEAIQMLTNSQQQASSLAAPAPVSPITNPPPSASNNGNSGNGSDALSSILPTLLSSLTAAPALAATNQKQSPYDDPQSAATPPTGGGGGGDDPNADQMTAGNFDDAPPNGFAMPNVLSAEPFGPVATAAKDVAAQTGMPMGGIPAGAAAGGGGGGSSRRKNTTTADNGDFKPASLPGVFGDDDHEHDHDNLYFDVSAATAQKWLAPTRNV